MVSIAKMSGRILRFALQMVRERHLLIRLGPARLSLETLVAQLSDDKPKKSNRPTILDECFVS